MWQLQVIYRSPCSLQPFLWLIWITHQEWTCWLWRSKLKSEHMALNLFHMWLWVWRSPAVVRRKTLHEEMSQPNPASASAMFHLTSLKIWSSLEMLARCLPHGRVCVLVKRHAQNGKSSFGSLALGNLKDQYQAAGKFPELTKIDITYILKYSHNIAACHCWAMTRE